MKMGSPGRTPEEDDEDILQAVIAACEAKEAPMAKTKEIRERGDLSIEQQTVVERLFSLEKVGKVHSIRVGPGYAWSIAEESDVEADPSRLNWDFLEIEDIPKEVVMEHPDFESNSFLRKWKNSSDNLLFLSALVGILGGGLFILREWVESTFSLYPDFGNVAALIFVSAVIFMVFSAVISGGLYLLLQLSKYGAGDYYRTLRRRVKSHVNGVLPIDIDRGDQSFQISWGKD